MGGDFDTDFPLGHIKSSNNMNPFIQTTLGLIISPYLNVIDCLLNDDVLYFGLFRKVLIIFVVQ